MNELDPGRPRALRERSFLGGDYASGSEFASDSIAIGPGHEHGVATLAFPFENRPFGAYVGDAGSIAIGASDGFVTGARAVAFYTIAIGLMAGQPWQDIDSTSGESIFIGNLCWSFDATGDSGGQHTLIGHYNEVEANLFFTTGVGDGISINSDGGSAFGEGAAIGTESAYGLAFGAAAFVGGNSPGAVAVGFGAYAEGISALALGGDGDEASGDGFAQALADFAVAIGGSDDGSSFPVIASHVASLAMLRGCQTNFDYQAKIGSVAHILDAPGGLRVRPFMVDNGNYTVASRGTTTDKETVVLVRSENGPLTITLPPIDAEEVGRVVIIKKTDSGAAGQSNVTVAADTGNPDLIDGVATKVLTANYEQIRLVAAFVPEWSVI